MKSECISNFRNYNNYNCEYKIKENKKKIIIKILITVKNYLGKIFQSLQFESI